MKRWWDDKETALGVLERVDASDVEQGVATAALGYHAIAKAAIAPYAAQTLVDAADLNAALFAIDVSPVAKALAAACEPIMGEASEHYGKLLASDLHAKAMAATSTSLATLTAAGVPVPFAIERVAEVVGLPSDHSGKYLAAMKAPAVQPIVKADAADRALMAFAQHLGMAEASAPPPERPMELVSKTAAFEAEHPRDPHGLFADKGEADPDAERRARIARRRKRVSSSSAPEQQAERKVPSLASLADLLPPPMAERQYAERQHAPRQLAERAVAPLAELAGRAKEAVRKPSKAKEPPAPAEQHRLLAPPKISTPQETTNFDAQGDETQIFLVPTELVDDIRAAGGFYAENLAKLLGAERLNTGSTVAAQHVLNIAGAGNSMLAGSMTAIRITGRLPVLDVERGSQRTGQQVIGATVAGGARFRVTNGDTVAYDTVTVLDGTEGDEGQARYLDSSFQVNVIDVVLDNSEDFSKAALLETWSGPGERHLRLVSRDELGQFSDEDAGIAVPDERKERIKRRRRRMRASAIRPDERAAPSLASLAALLPEEPIAERKHAPRQMAERKLAARAVRERAAQTRTTATAAGNGMSAEARKRIEEFLGARTLITTAGDLPIRFNDGSEEHDGWTPLAMEGKGWVPFRATGITRPMNSKDLIESVTDWQIHGHGSNLTDTTMTREDAEKLAQQVGANPLHRAHVESVEGGYRLRITRYSQDPAEQRVFIDVSPEDASDLANDKGEFEAQLLGTGPDGLQALEEYHGIQGAFGSDLPSAVVIVVRRRHDGKK